MKFAFVDEAVMWMGKRKVPSENEFNGSHINDSWIFEFMQTQLFN